MKKLLLPPTVKRELVELAARAGRSTGFVARRALAAASSKLSNERSFDISPAREALQLALDEDDDPKTLARVEALAKPIAPDPGLALALAWMATRDEFHAWLQRHEAAEAAARADDLDAALAEAASSTDGARLAALAAHEYVQVRARVARNPATPVAALERLAAEREKTIRRALVENPSTPQALRARLG